MKDSEIIVARKTPETGWLEEMLAAPFGEDAIKVKPGAVAGNRALALFYVDARAIQDRLDEALGVSGWQDEYDCLPDGSVVCRLRLKINGEWITKMDVGGPSEQPDEGDRRKAAFSDALKRAAVKFGIGRYLYRLEHQWADFDPQKKRFVKLPRPSLPTPTRKMPANRNGAGPEPKKTTVKPMGPGKKDLPASGEELHQRLSSYDARLAAQGLCGPGDLVKHVVQAGTSAGYERDLTTWTGPAIALAVEETRQFEAACREKKQDRREVA